MNHSRAPLAHLLGLGLLMWCSPTPADEPADPRRHFSCTMADGTVRVFAHDVALRFASVVHDCVPTEAPRSSGPIATPEDDDNEAVRVIYARRQAALGGPAAVSALIATTAERHGVDPRLLHAVVRVESNYDASALSPKGAVGLMQVMPSTAARFGVAASELRDPGVNLDVGTRYLRWLAGTFEGRLELQLAAYNAGEGAVRRNGDRIPPYPETQDYVRKVLALYFAR